MSDDEPYRTLHETSTRLLSRGGSRSGGGDRPTDPWILERARLLFGCYRRGDAADPDTYVTAVAIVLAGYADAIVEEVTDPASGIPSKIAWLPSVKEVRDACEDLQHSPRYRSHPNLEGLAERFAGKTYRGKPYQHYSFNGRPLTATEFQQLLDREAFDNAQHLRDTDPTRPSYDDLKRKHGARFGIGDLSKVETPEQINARWSQQVKPWSEIAADLAADPTRLQRLADLLPTMRGEVE